MYSARNLSETEAELIAEAYFRASKNPKKVAEYLGVETFDMSLLANPIVRRKILDRAKMLSKKYSIDDHLSKLKEIRDSCIDDANYKVALSAEVALGKAAGLYDLRKDEEPETGKVEPEKLTTDQIRRLLAKRTSPIEEESQVPQIEYIPESDLNEDGLA